MPGEHARLSPSASERWLACPASVRLAATMPEPPDSPYAAEGTCAHELGEIKVRHAFDQIDEVERDARLDKWRANWEVTDSQEIEMGVHTDAYVALVRERAALYPHTQVLVEQRLDTGVPTCWGTSDTVLVSPAHVEIIDLKYGQGVRVEAEGNSQLRLYALGALDTYGDLLGDTEAVRSTVFQPRIGDGHVVTEELTPTELREWREQILPVAAEALGEDARFGPSESACRWCPASGNCRAQMDSIFGDLDLDVEPETLTEAELAEQLDRVAAIKDWLLALESAALERAYGQGKELPGWKVVLAGGKRSLTDQATAIAYLVDELNFERAAVAKESLRGIGELETLMGKEGFARIMEPYIKPPVGKPALVPATDGRPAVDAAAAAAAAFSEEGA